jgi:hypothetical protein
MSSGRAERGPGGCGQENQRACPSEGWRLKRQIVTDTGSLLVGAEVPADIQDRDGAALVIETIHQLVPWLRHLFADSLQRR